MLAMARPLPLAAVARLRLLAAGTGVGTGAPWVGTVGTGGAPVGLPWALSVAMGALGVAGAVVGDGWGRLQMEPARPALLSRSCVADAAAAVAPAVVNLATMPTGGVMPGGGVFGMDAPAVAATGSGFIVDAKGVVVTNAHVVRGAAAAGVRVTLHDGRTVNGKVVAADAASDIAVVQLDADKSPYPCARLGRSDNLRAGEFVVALGSPLHLDNTVTCGIISNTTRRASDLGMGGGARARTAYLQTDAAINQGNSGGPLCDLDGHVVGVNTMKALGADGVSFAIPIDDAKGVIAQLLEHGRVRRPYVGMKLLALTPGICESLRASSRTSFPPKECESAVLVPHVHPGAPAERGGLRSGDVIVKANGQDVNGVQMVMDALDPGKGSAIGSKVHFEVMRRDASARGGITRVRVTVQTEEMRQSR